MGPNLDPAEHLQRFPASEVKRCGWKGVMRTLGAKGKVLVTNHERPEAVILTAEEYDRIVTFLRQAQEGLETDLEVLRERFDARLASLNTPDAGARLRAAMDAPALPNPKRKAGDPT